MQPPTHTTGHTHIPLATCHEGSRVTCHADTGRADLCTGSRFKTQYNLITSHQKNCPQLLNVLYGWWPGEATSLHQLKQPGCCVKWNTTATRDALMLKTQSLLKHCRPELLSARISSSAGIKQKFNVGLVIPNKLQNPPHK